MKKYIYTPLLLLFIMGMISCNKEEIIVEEPTIILDPPVEVSYPVALGIVKNENGTLADALISVYQKGVLVGTTRSNENGEYSTIDIETTEGEDLILKYSKETYNSGYRKRSDDVLKSTSLDIELVSADGVSGYPQLFPGISDYISLSGYVLDTDGGPGYARIGAELEAIFYDENVAGGQGILNISYSEITDSDGYYELILPKESSELRVAVYDDRYCFDYLTEEVKPIVGGLIGEPMGPFLDDAVLPDYVNVRSAAPLLELAGRVVSCDGSVVSGTQVSLIIEAMDGSSYIQVFNTDSDGSFTYTDDDCSDLPYTVKIIGENPADNMHSDTTVIIVSDGVYSNQNIDLNTCNETVSGFSSAVMNVDGVDYTFDQIVTRMENGGLVSDEITLSFAIFTIPNIQLGDSNIIQNFELNDWATFYYFKATNNPMTADVTALSSTEATVILTGDFDFNGNTVQGTCTLNLKF